MKGFKAMKKRTFAMLLATLLVLCSVDYGVLSAAAEPGSSTETHEHDGKTFVPWSEASISDLGNGNYTLVPGNYYLTDDVTLAGELMLSSNTASICLNGHTIKLAGKAIYLEQNATLNIYDCTEAGVITGGNGHYASGWKGGAIYVKSSTLNLYDGTIEDNSAAWGGAIFIDASEAGSTSTVNMYGGTIQNNTAESGGGGIEVENEGSVFNMYGGNIINNKVTSLNGGVHKGGGVHFAAGSMTIDGTVNISGNQVAGLENNLYLRNGKIFKVNSIGEDSRIGVSSYNIENSASYNVSIAEYRGNISSADLKYYFMDGMHDKTKYALVNDGKYLQIIPHTHSWKYRAGTGDSENTLYAYCDTTTSKCGYYGESCTALPLTIKALSPVAYNGDVYSGAELCAEELAVFKAATGESLSNSDIVYYTTANLSQKTGTTDGAAGDGKAPANIGTYYAAVKVNDVVAKVKFIIEGAPIKITKPTGLTKEFNNAEQELVTAGSVKDASTSASAGSMQYQVAANDSELLESGWSEDIPKATAVGKYRVYYRVVTDKNHMSVDYTQGYPYEMALITNKDMEVPVIGGIENGGKYCESVTFAVTGDNLDKVTVDGTEVTPDANGRYTIIADNKSHTIVVKDIAGNVRNYTITVYTEHDFENPVYEETGKNGDIITEGASCGHGCGGEVIRKRTEDGDIISLEYPSAGGTKGSLATDVKVKTGTPATSVSGLDIEVAKAFLDPATELPRVQNGESLLVYLKVNKLEESAIPADDKTETEKKAATISDLQQGIYLGLSMWKKIGAADEVQLMNAETAKELKITITLPEELKAPSGKVRTYYVIRVHNGVATMLPVELNGDEISFKTDMFSTYSIWYTEIKAPTPPSDGDDTPGTSSSSDKPANTTESNKPNSNNTGSANLPKTGDESNVAFFQYNASVVGSCYGQNYSKKEKKIAQIRADKKS